MVQVWNHWTAVQATELPTAPAAADASPGAEAVTTVVAHISGQAVRDEQASAKCDGDGSERDGVGEGFRAETAVKTVQCTETLHRVGAIPSSRTPAVDRVMQVQQVVVDTAVVDSITRETTDLQSIEGQTVTQQVVECETSRLQGAALEVVELEVTELEIVELEAAELKAAELATVEQDLLAQAVQADRETQQELLVELDAQDDDDDDDDDELGVSAASWDGLGLAALATCAADAGKPVKVYARGLGGQSSVVAHPQAKHRLPKAQGPRPKAQGPRPKARGPKRRRGLMRKHDVWHLDH